jgi:DNA-binding transcriptional MerR regulator
MREVAQAVKFYSSAEVAHLLGISKRTLLRYEKRGLVPKAHRNYLNGWRQYDEESVGLLRRLMGRDR